MSYRSYPPSGPLLIGYDPESVLSPDHLARLIDQIVDESVTVVRSLIRRAGQPSYDPRLCVKVILYGYATGLRSSRQLEKHCEEHLAYRFLTRGETPSYRTLCSARLDLASEIEECWTAVFAIAGELGIKRIGRIDIDSTKIRANVSADSVLKETEYDFFRTMLKEMIAQAESQDRIEEAEGYAGQTQTGRSVGKDQMREVIRNIRKAFRARQKGDAEATPAAVDLGPRMVPILEESVEAIEAAMGTDRKHLSLTDPDAQMMTEGRSKRIQECHALEVAVDTGLLVCAQSSQSPTDANRLMGIVEAAQVHEPEGVKAVTADTGYYGGDNLIALTEAGIDTCIPDSFTARDMRKGLPVGSTHASSVMKVTMVYDEAGDRYICANGRVLRLEVKRKSYGCDVKVYRPSVDCTDCPLRSECMKSETGKRRTIKRAVNHTQIKQLLARFDDVGRQQRYKERGKNVETVFAFIRTVLNFNRWLLRGKNKVAAEESFLSTAYQIRKINTAQRKLKRANAVA